MPFWRRKVRPLDLLLVLISLAYPFVVYFGLMRFSPLVVGLALVAFLLLRIALQRGRRIGGRSEAGLYLFILGAVLLLLLLDELLAVKAYPVLISLSFAALFGFSLISPPPIIERIDVVRTARVRRAKLYFLRKLSGKAARMRERKG